VGDARTVPGKCWSGTFDPRKDAVDFGLREHT
jgi:hypothetical protein